MEKFETGLTKEQMDLIIKELNLTPSYEITTINGEKVIVEKWRDKMSVIGVNKVYYLNEETLSLIPDKTREEFLTKEMEKCAEIEDYDGAIYWRDLLKTFKK